MTPGYSRPRTSSRAEDEVGDRARELGATVLLEEVPAAGNRRVRLVGAARDASAQRAVGTAGDRVGVTERAQKWLRELLEHRPRDSVRRRLGIVGRGRHEHGE